MYRCNSLFKTKTKVKWCEAQHESFFFLGQFRFGIDFTRDNSINQEKVLVKFSECVILVWMWDVRVCGSRRTCVFRITRLLMKFFDKSFVSEIA